ncbi:hypothetical protein JKP88DRAFT_255303 [Tribonema minus]|uniref:Uncharacterized protein n=1 Tax=Tribonema minus TaxID=303371 RepID=A0A835Z335_9STRA|nr:hypothetical protein JKP88DRAFT_255303 [Tribonema minus]
MHVRAAAGSSERRSADVSLCELRAERDTFNVQLHSVGDQCLTLEQADYVLERNDVERLESLMARQTELQLELNSVEYSIQQRTRERSREATCRVAAGAAPEGGGGDDDSNSDDSMNGGGAGAWRPRGFPGDSQGAEAEAAAAQERVVAAEGAETLAITTTMEAHLPGQNMALDSALETAKDNAARGMPDNLCLKIFKKTLTDVVYVANPGLFVMQVELLRVEVGVALRDTLSPITRLIQQAEAHVPADDNLYKWRMHVPLLNFFKGTWTALQQLCDRILLNPDYRLHTKGPCPITLMQMVNAVQNERAAQAHTAAPYNPLDDSRGGGGYPP